MELWRKDFQKYKYIFIILNYRNTSDVLNCIRSIEKHVKNYKIVMINSHYDKKSEKILHEIADAYKCDFIDVPNLGYGYGNNKGIEYAAERYCFDFIIICNPDIMIESWSDKPFDKFSDAVFAPIIRTKRGKSQNPYWAKKNNFAEWLIYNGYKLKNKWLLYFGIAINKIIREIFLKCFYLRKINEIKVYAAHGSFCIFPKKIFDNNKKIYDEKMFLFAEEAYLAHMLEKQNIKTILTKRIKIRHVEDGCIKFEKIDEESIQRKSVVYYYEKIKK